MTIGRNDPCYCGSGKKYKKCCMNKQNVVELQAIKEERFYHEKYMLVTQLQDFISEKIPSSLFFPLESEFNRRSNRLLKGDSGFVQFWMIFSHRYENGLRGIEWFLAENEHRLSEEERNMATTWATLKMQLLQAVDETDSIVTFKDFFTGETYPVSKSKENIPVVYPWASTLGILEPMGDRYFFNGVRSIVNPKGFEHAVQCVKQLMKDTGLTHEQVLFDYYPEVLLALHNEFDKEDAEKEVVEYNYTFKLTDRDRAENFLYNDDDLQIEFWEADRKELGWLDNFTIYTDSEIDGQVRQAEALAYIDIKDDILTFSSYDLAITNQFLRKIGKAEGSILLIDDQEEHHTVPLQFDVMKTTASIDVQVPEYFILYAQNAVNIEMDRSLPTYQATVKELVENGRVDEAETWLKQLEFSMYQLVHKQYDTVEITADFNTVRKELGLELSPFVTGGDKRWSKIEPYVMERRPSVVLEEDIPIYENLGFAQDTVDAFYADDIVAFYKEKAHGKSEGTERKYRNSLYDIREAIQISSIDSWAECDLEFWETLLAEDFFELNEAVSKSMVKDMITVVKLYSKWLEKQHKIDKAKQVTELAKQYEPRMLTAVNLLEQESSNRGRGYIPELSKIAGVLRNIDKQLHDIESGEYLIIKVNKNSVRVKSHDSQELTISLREKTLSYAEVGFILHADIGKYDNGNTWELIHLERVTIAGAGSFTKV